MLGREVSSRWLLPLAVSICTVTIALSWLRSGGDSRAALVMVLATGTWAWVAWWVAASLQRHQRLVCRWQRLQLLLPTVLLIGTLLVLDFSSDLVSGLCAVIGTSPLAGAVVVVLGATLGTVLLAHDRPRALLQNVCTLVLSAVLVLVLAEVLLRAVLLEPVVPKDRRRFEQLFADAWPRPIPLAKPAGSYRLLGLADSFGWVGEESNYHWVLEQLLQEQTSACEVVNLSVPGYELPEELALLRRFGSGYGPDLVLHGLFVGNDLWVPEGEAKQFLGIPVRTGIGSVRLWPHRFLLREWIEAVALVMKDRAGRQRQRQLEGTAGELSHEEFLRIERKRMGVLLRGGLTAEGASWRAVTAMLDEIRAVASGMGAEYVLVVHPDQVQVELPLLRELTLHYRLDPSSFDLEQPQRLLREYCDTRGARCLDLLPLFRQQGYGGGLYLLDNTHYNEEGNRLAAEAIRSFLHAHRLLPDDTGGSR